jgi:hypothetical protein
MGLKQLKEQNPNFNINIIDILSKIDNTKTKKLIPFLVKLIKNKINNINDDFDYYRLNERPHMKNVSLEFCDFQRPLIMLILDNYVGFDNVELIPVFVDYLERGLIDNKDISTYQTMSDLVNEIGKASTKEMLSKDRKSIMVVHDDDEWMFFKPLTYSASVAYGYGTKWCTSMKNESEYFYRYSKNGVIIYVINKVTGKKFGIHSNDEVRMGIYDETDKQIDSFETDIPNNLIMKLFNLLDLKNNKTNFEFFSDEEKVKCDKLDRFDRFIPVPVPGVGLNDPMSEIINEDINLGTDNNFTVVNRLEPELALDLNPTHHHLIVRDIIQQQINDMMTKVESVIDDLP